MNRLRPHRHRLVLVGVLALAAPFAAACSERTEQGATPPTDRNASVFAIGLVGNQPEGEPAAGGRLDVATFSEVRSLDPVDVLANGLSGGSELAAIYDVLVRYDPETTEYEPQLAESVEADDELVRWTLTLREEATFSDGTPVDADAVVASIERYLAEEGGQASLWSRKVASTEALDERTVEFRLTEPWVDFEYLLATAPGMIVAPAATAGETFEPVGAGPFRLVHQRPAEELLLEANPEYWAGPPPLEELRFHLIPTAQGTLDVIKAGDTDVAVLREPHVIADAVDSGLAGAMNVLSMGVGLIVNSREGSATADVLVRRAIAQTLEPETIFQRTYSGIGLPGTGMFPAESQWRGETAGPEIDLDAARALVEEAKAKGFDGTVRYLGIAKVSQNTGLGIEAMLGQIGIEVESEYVRGATEMIQKVFVERDFDLAGWSFGAPDAAVYPELYESFHSESSANAGGYASEAMDELIDELGVAGTEAEQRAVLERIQEEWNRSVPAIVFGAQPEFVAWTDDVGGVVPHVDSMMLYHRAWVAA